MSFKLKSVLPIGGLLLGTSMLFSGGVSAMQGQGPLPRTPCDETGEISKTREVEEAWVQREDNWVKVLEADVEIPLDKTHTEVREFGINLSRAPMERGKLPTGGLRNWKQAAEKSEEQCGQDYQNAEVFSCGEKINTGLHVSCKVTYRKDTTGSVQAKVRYTESACDQQARNATREEVQLALDVCDSLGRGEFATEATQGMCDQFASHVGLNDGDIQCDVAAPKKHKKAKTKRTKRKKLKAMPMPSQS
jgi:hypothetical protein